MKKIFWLVFLWMGASLAAPFPEAMQKMRCRDHVGADLKKVGSMDKWTRVAESGPQHIAYRTPLKKLGHWADLQQDFDGAPRLVLYQPGSTTAMDYNKLCEKKKTTLKPLFQGPFNSPQFTDADLGNLLGKKRNGLIYIWSPSVEQSIKSIEVYKKFAETYGLEFVPLMAGNQRGVAGAKKGLPEGKHLAAVDLQMRSMFDFPTAYVFSGGKLSWKPITAVKAEGDLTIAVAKSMIELKQDEAR